MTVAQVSQNVYRGPRPDGVGDYLVLRDLDIDVIINLEMGIYSFLRGQMNTEAEECAHRGLEVINYHLSAICPPTKHQVDFLLTSLFNSDPKLNIYIHCKDGVDRTGMISAYIRCLHVGWPVEAAITEMYNMGFHRWRYFWWVRSLRRNVKALLEEKAYGDGQTETENDLA